MKDLLEKLSSYNLFNYLFPGILFAAMADQITSYPLLMDDIVVGVFVYYFYGIVISRIGSLIIEPLFKWVRIVRFASYPDFIKASQKDGKIELLSESNNMYRTLTAVFFCILILVVFGKLGQNITFVGKHSKFIGVIFLLLLFSFSYRKQTSYIRSRISHLLKNETAKEEKD